MAFLAVLCAALASGAGAQASGLVGARAASRVAGTGPAAVAVRLEQGSGVARLVFDLTASVEAKAFVLADPNRVIIDLPETAFLLDPSSGRSAETKGKAAGIIKSYRFGLFAPGRSRIVIDLGQPARIVRASAEANATTGTARLVVELAQTDAASFQAAAGRSVAPLSAAIAKVASVSPANASKPLVVLDPGHGGVDTGAAGNKDAVEKNIVADFAHDLAAKLEASGKVRVLLTRTSDVFVALGDRVKIAEDAHADLFVSIHADTLTETFVQGATVYTLSDKASDVEAARVADKENAADRAGGLTDVQDVIGVNDILHDLTRRETRALSHGFARTLVDYWRQIGNLNKNPMRSAGFRVLKAPEVPSVLLELGYLSNEKDISLLTSPEWRQRSVARIADSIERHFADRIAGRDAATAGGVERVAGADKNVTR